MDVDLFEFSSLPESFHLRDIVGSSTKLISSFELKSEHLLGQGLNSFTDISEQLK